MGARCVVSHGCCRYFSHRTSRWRVQDLHGIPWESPRDTTPSHPQGNAGAHDNAHWRPWVPRVSRMRDRRIPQWLPWYPREPMGALIGCRQSNRSSDLRSWNGPPWRTTCQSGARQRGFGLFREKLCVSSRVFDISNIIMESSNECYEAR